MMASTSSISASATQSAVPPPGANLLWHEPSPYLRQHAFNPVQWLPWDLGIREAARTGKPIFLSSGYSTCHWCHVMERECFSQVEVAEALNPSFVCIKVDRETRPDVDGVHMAYLQATEGRGGWPLSVFLTPSLEPFYGATYIPKVQFLRLVKRIAGLWADPIERAELQDTARQVVQQLQAGHDKDTYGPVEDEAGAHLPAVKGPASRLTSSSSSLHPAADHAPWLTATTARSWDGTARGLLKRFDPAGGGFSTSAPKFPRPTELQAPLAYSSVTVACQNEEARAGNAGSTAGTAQAQAPATVASVPFMITRAMRAQLAALGYGPDQVRSMTPAQAWAVLNPPCQTQGGSGEDTAQGKAPAAGTATAGQPQQQPTPPPVSIDLHKLASRIGATGLRPGARLDLAGLTEPQGRLPVVFAGAAASRASTPGQPSQALQPSKPPTVSPSAALLSSWYSLRRMASGGLWDSLGGGWHRYSTDSVWRVPHFEKMLYDQNAMLGALCQGYQATGDPALASLARGTVGYLARDVVAADDQVPTTNTATAGQGGEEHDTARDTEAVQSSPVPPAEDGSIPTPAGLCTAEDADSLLWTARAQDQARAPWTEGSDGSTASSSDSGSSGSPTSSIISSSAAGSQGGEHPTTAQGRTPAVQGSAHSHQAKAEDTTSELPSREGAYYLWTWDELEAVLAGGQGAERADTTPGDATASRPSFLAGHPPSLLLQLARHHWSLTDHSEGNTRSSQRTDPHGELYGLNILAQSGELAATAAASGAWTSDGRHLTIAQTGAALAYARHLLKAHRDAIRPRPLRDGKVLCGLNGQALASICQASLTVAVPCELRVAWGAPVAVPELERGSGQHSGRANGSTEEDAPPRYHPEDLSTLESQYEGGGRVVDLQPGQDAASSGASNATPSVVHARPLDTAAARHASMLRLGHGIALYLWRHLVVWPGPGTEGAGAGDVQSNMQASSDTGTGHATSQLGSPHAPAHPSLVYDSQGLHPPYLWECPALTQAPGTTLRRAVLADEEGRDGLHNGGTQTHDASTTTVRPPQPSFLDDSSSLIHGLLWLYQAGGPAYGWALGWARALQEAQDQHFWVEVRTACQGDAPGAGQSAARVPENGPGEHPSALECGAYATRGTNAMGGQGPAAAHADGGGPLLPMRDIPTEDGAEPSPNAVSLLNLVTMAALTRGTAVSRGAAGDHGAAGHAPAKEDHGLQLDTGGDEEASQAYTTRAVALARYLGPRVASTKGSNAGVSPLTVVALDALRLLLEGKYTTVDMEWPGGPGELGTGAGAATIERSPGSGQVHGRPMLHALPRDGLEWLLAAHALPNHARVVRHSWAGDQGELSSTSATVNTSSALAADTASSPALVARVSRGRSLPRAITTARELVAAASLDYPSPGDQRAL